MSKVGLAALVSPLTVNEFMTGHWPKEFFVVHNLETTIASLTQLPFLKSREALLNVWPNKVQAHLPDAKDEVSAVEVSAGDARKLFANGMALLFDNAQKISPDLTRWLDAIRKELGLPISTHARCLIYATPDGKGNAAHFDQNINFVLQLQGTKTWWLAPNDNVENPSQRHTMGMPLDRELKSYLQDKIPESMPVNAARIVLTPGSMLFVPRGFWHRTEASGEALALNFTFSQPMWLDLFLSALRSRLLLSDEWRELADGVNSTDHLQRHRAQETLGALIEELKLDLPHWQAADILATTEGDG